MARPLLDYDDDDTAIMNLDQIENKASRINNRPSQSMAQIDKRQEERSALMDEINRYVKSEELKPLTNKERDMFVLYGNMPDLERHATPEPEAINELIGKRVEEKTGVPIPYTSNPIGGSLEIARSYLHPETMKKVHPVCWRSRIGINQVATRRCCFRHL